MPKACIYENIELSLKLAIVFAHVSIFLCLGSRNVHSDGKKIDFFEMWCYRRLFRISWIDERTNQWMLDKTGTSFVPRKNMILKKMRFFGHIIRK